MAKRRPQQLQAPTMFGPPADAVPAAVPPPPVAFPPTAMPRVSGPPAPVPLPDAPNAAKGKAGGPVDVGAMIAAAIANGTHAPPDLTAAAAEPADVPASTAVAVARMAFRRMAAAVPCPWTLADVLGLWAMEHWPEAAAGACEDHPENPRWFGECMGAIFRRRALLDWRFAAWAAELWPADVVKLAPMIRIPGLDARWVESIGLLEGVAPLARPAVVGRIEPQTRKAAA